MMVYNGKPYENGWFGGTIIFGNIHIAGCFFLRKEGETYVQAECELVLSLEIFLFAASWSYLLYFCKGGFLNASHASNFYFKISSRVPVVIHNIGTPQAFRGRVKGVCQIWEGMKSKNPAVPHFKASQVEWIHRRIWKSDCQNWKKRHPENVDVDNQTWWDNLQVRGASPNFQGFPPPQFFRCRCRFSFGFSVSYIQPSKFWQDWVTELPLLPTTIIAGYHSMTIVKHSWQMLTWNLYAFKKNAANEQKKSKNQMFESPKPLHLIRL